MDSAIKKIRTELGLSQAQFAKRFNLPIRSLQDWEQGRFKTPPYVISMIERILELEKENKELTEQNKI